jgi:hemoglobin
MDSLYDRIGGLPALEVAVERFYERVRADREVAPLFASTERPRHKSRLIAWLGHMTGGPTRPPAADSRPEELYVEAVTRHLPATLEELGIEGDLAASIVAGMWPRAGAAAA